MEKQVQIIASDAGGTMTDMMVVDGEERMPSPSPCGTHT